MRRRIVIGLLALGTFVGYGSGVAHAVRMHRAMNGQASPCSGWHAQE